MERKGVGADGGWKSNSAMGMLMMGTSPSGRGTREGKDSSEAAEHFDPVLQLSQHI